MKVTFLGAAHEVTGSCTLVEAAGKRILVDCGMEQGEDIYENCTLPVCPQEIDAVCLTHAHIDHSGKLPALVAHGFRGSIYATEATRRLCEIMLRDSAHIQEFEAEWRNRKAKRADGDIYVPQYTMADAEKTLTLFSAHGYGEEIPMFAGCSVSFTDAGHLLGSANVLLTLQEGEETRKILFSGDLGNVNRPLIRDPQTPPEADYVVIESTYGDRLHGPRPDYLGQLTQILQDTFDRGGNLVIPSFAVGRTQEMLYLLREIRTRGLLCGHENFPVYVDSPLAVEATRIYSSGMTEYYDQRTLELLAKGIDPISFPGLRLTITAEESKQINFDQEPKVILSASGMCEAGRIRHHLKHNLWRKESTILLVGYQAEGTVGRKVLEGAQEVRLFGEDIAVHANIATLSGISGHADQGMLLGWLEHMPRKPGQVFVNHGDDQICDIFADLVEKKLGIPAIAPFSGDCYDLLTGECLAKGRIVRVEAKSKGRQRAEQVYDRLTAAGKRLLAVIGQCRGLSNRELAKFADQINALCDKFQRK